MNVDFFLKLSKFHIASLVTAEDFADKFNFQISTAVILLSVAIVGIRQYIFTPIQCWTPKEFDKSWEEYAENYCWVSDTYFSKVATGPPELIANREGGKIGYYQWVPFVLGLQALLFYSPHLLWKLLSARAGTNIRAIVRYASEASTIDQDKQAKMVGFLARQMEKVIVARRRLRRYPAGPYGRARRCCSACSLGLPLLLSFYFLIKCLYLGNAVGQVYLMSSFLGFNSSTFGADILYDLFAGRTWHHSGIFPRVTWCDFIVRRVGNPQRYSVQCVLPINMLNEKLYIFLWFWVTAAAVLTSTSLVSWMVAMLNYRQRRRFVKYYLRLMSGPNALGTSKKDEEDPRLLHRFVSNFLGYDGVFMLHMIAHNTGELVVADVLHALWRVWREKHGAIDVNEDDGQPLVYTLHQPPVRKPMTAPPLPPTHRRAPQSPSLKQRRPARLMTSQGEFTDETEAVAV